MDTQTQNTTADRPTVDRGIITFDRAEYKRYWSDTPLNPPASGVARMNLAPGTCVKTSRGELCGRVHTNAAEGCVVIGHGWENWDSERFVWKGTSSEFASLWSID